MSDPRESALLVIKFIMWMNETGVYSPNSIKTICGKLRWNFVCNVADDSVFDSPSVRTALKGLSSNDGTRPACLKKSPSNSLLWIMELNDLARDTLWVSNCQDNRMNYIAISLAFHFSLRIGEVANVGPYYKAPKFTPDHRFYWCDIVLEDFDGETEYSFAQFRATFPKPNIELVLFLKNSSKTSGRELADGKPYYLTRNSPAESLFLDDFLCWVVECNHSDETFPIAARIHTSRQSRLDLQSCKMIEAMNQVGKVKGLQGFTGKSLRGGGASSLSAAGCSDTQILNSVGHASLSSNQHYQSGTSSGNVYAMGVGNPISVRDVRRVQGIIHLNASKKRVRSDP